MGYRSEVKAIFYVSLQQLKNGKKIKNEEKKTRELALLIHAFFKEQATSEVFPQLHECFKFKKTGVEFYANDIKWYDSYAEVIAFNELHQLYNENFCSKDDNPGFHWEFYRVGEDYDDTEVRQSADATGLLWISRIIKGDLD